MREKMNIVLASDDKYMGFIATTLLSLFEHKNEDDEFDVFIFDDNISDQSKQKLLSLTQRFGIEPIYMPVPTTEELCGVTFMNQRWSSTMILRLFVGSLFPNEIKRIIFLDGDIYIRNSLRELWEIDLEGCYLGGVQECTGDKRKANLGLSPNANYINAGVEIIDLDALRKSDAEEKYRRFLRKHNGYIPEVEQGTCNACISDHIMLVHPKWNAHTTFFMFDYDIQRKIKKPSVYPTREEVEEAISDPVCVHFSGCCFSDIRPWQGGQGKSDHPYALKFMETKARTPWNDPLYSPDNRSTFKRFCHWMYKHFPMSIYSAVMAFGYQVILPKQEARKIEEAKKRNA